MVCPRVLECSSRRTAREEDRGQCNRQDRINAYRDLSNSYIQIPAIKAMIAHRSGDPGWLRLRPPLLSLSAAEQADLARRLTALSATHPATGSGVPA